MRDRRKARVGLAVALLTAAFAATGPAQALAQSSATPAKPPTHAQIQNALHRAERSPNLWATVNICDTKRHPGVIGLRAQMPALGFASTLKMRFQVDYWSAKAKRYKPVPGARHPLSLGVQKTGLHQEGVQFSFPKHSGRLRGAVTFEWAHGSRTLGQALENTTRGHHTADFGDPAHYSAPKCVI
jgi:hypothetical protein